jgi:hypothetical protein
LPRDRGRSFAGRALYPQRADQRKHPDRIVQAGPGVRQSAKGVPEHVGLTCGRANTWLHVGGPVRSRRSGILGGAPGWPEKQEHQGDISFQHSELHRRVPASAIDVLIGQFVPSIRTALKRESCPLGQYAKAGRLVGSRNPCDRCPPLGRGLNLRRDLDGRLACEPGKLFDSGLIGVAEDAGSDVCRCVRARAGVRPAARYGFQCAQAGR